jgi:hypothetical protein
MIYTIPDNISSITDDDIIDMSVHNFGVDVEDPIKSAFIFIRNTELKAKFDFSNCTYDQKCKYLMMFMFGSFDIHMQDLTDTWMAILLSKKYDQDVFPCLFTHDEINKFVSENSEVLSEVYQLVISLPVFALWEYDNNCKNRYNSPVHFDLTKYEHTDYNKINLHNFTSLTFNQDFVRLGARDNDDIQPKFYESYLVGYQFMNWREINDNLPYLKLLNIIYSDDAHREAFINSLSSLGNKEDESNE